MPLRVLDSPYREITRPVVDYVKAKRRDSPRDIIDVYVPEYVVGRWWETLLHNQSAFRVSQTPLDAWSRRCLSSVPAAVLAAACRPARELWRRVNETG